MKPPHSRPYRDLRPIPLAETFADGRVITMSEGQWDAILAAAYNAGWTLLELDDRELPVRAYRKAEQPVPRQPADDRNGRRRSDRRGRRGAIVPRDAPRVKSRRQLARTRVRVGS